MQVFHDSIQIRLIKRQVVVIPQISVVSYECDFHNKSLAIVRYIGDDLKTDRPILNGAIINYQLR